MPMPPDLVVKKGLNSWSVFSAETPTPQSVNRYPALDLLRSWCDRITSWARRFVTGSIASMP